MWRLAIAEEKLAGLMPMVINMSYEEQSVSFEVQEMGQLVPIRDVVRELVPIEDLPPLWFTSSLHQVNELVEELVERSQVRDQSDYNMASLSDNLGELFHP